MIAEAAVLLSVKDLAEMLQVTERTIWTWKEHGKLPVPVKIGGSANGGGTVRWRRGDVDEWVAAGCPNRARSQTEAA